MLEKTGSDAVMVGTAAIGNPGIFAEILGKKPIAREQAFLKYVELCKKFGVDSYFGRVKTQAVKFFEGNREKVILFQKAKTLEELALIAKKKR